MSPVAPEPSDIGIALTNLLGVTLLILCYVFGVWVRSYVYPADAKSPLRRQMVAAIPVGFVTMGLYAKSALPTIHFNQSGVFDAFTMIGYAIIFGMLSRESLERILASSGRNVSAAVAGEEASLARRPAEG
jgi:hypothetical protein